MRISTGSKIKGYFGNIHKALRQMQERCDTIIYDTASKSYQNTQNYKGEYYRSQQNKLLTDANASVVDAKQRCLQKVDREFANIQIALDEWITQPLPETFASVIDTFSRFNLTPTTGEITALQEAGQGSYLAGRLLDGLLRKSGLESHFMNVQAIQKDLREAKGDAHTAVNAYNGRLSTDNHYVADLIDGFVVSPSNMDMYYVFAEDFMDEERNNSLTRIEKSLCDATETEIALLPSKRNQISALFDGAEDDNEKVVIASRIIEDGGDIADLLPLYDKSLYTRACDYNRENTMREAVKATQEKQQAETIIQESVTKLARTAQAASKVEATA